MIPQALTRLFLDSLALLLTPAPGGSNVTACAIDILIPEDTVVLPSHGKFGTLSIFTTGIEILTIRVARNGFFPKQNKDHLRKCIVDFI